LQIYQANAISRNANGTQWNELPGTPGFQVRIQLHTRRMKNGRRIKIDMLTLQCLLKTLVMRCTEVPW
jgi:hypothetical protein